MIRQAPPAAVAWTTISDEAPDSSANWLSYKLMEQATARDTTPGTLTYTPANNTPGMNVAPWNSWLSPNCPPAGYMPAPATADPGTAMAGDHSNLWLLFGGVAAAAGALYIANNIGGRK